MLNTFYRAISTMLSPGGQDARLSILIYHRILPETDELIPFEVSAESFNTHLIILKSVFNVLPLSEATARLKTASLPPRAACITFDDGYADNATIALPILERHNLCATFFIATAYLNGGRMFNDTVIHAIRHSRDNRLNLSRLGLGEYDLSTLEFKRQAIAAILKEIRYLPLGQREDVAEELASLATNTPPPNDLMMDSGQVQALERAGMEVGGHTARHPILAKLDAVAACQEITEGRDFLESLLSSKVRLFAYPNGKPGVDYLPCQTNIVRRLGFDAAVSTRWGAARQSGDIFQLPRFTPYSNNMFRFAPLLIQNLMRGEHAK